MKDLINELLLEWSIEEVVNTINSNDINDIFEFYVDLFYEADITLNNEMLSYLKNEIKERGI